VADKKHDDTCVRECCNNTTDHARKGWLDQPPTYTTPILSRPETPTASAPCYTTMGLVSAAKRAQGDKVYCYRIMKSFMGLPEGGFIIADFNAIDLQAVVLADRDDPDSMLGVWREASVPLFGVAQDLGILQWWSCSELAWSLSQRRGSLQCSLKLMEGGAG